MRELQFIDYGGLTRLESFGLSLEEMFPEEAEEDRRINGRFRKFKKIDEISDEDIDARPGFQHLISGSEEILEEESEDLDDGVDDFELYDLVDRFGDGEFDKPIFVNAIVQHEEKEKIDKKSFLSNFIPLSKIKRKCESHKRDYSRRGRKESFRISIEDDINIVHTLDRGRMHREKMKLLSF